MSNVIYGNMVGGGSAPLKTLILTDENGNEVVGVVTENVKVFDATPDDVKIGKTFVSDGGILEGVDTRMYRTTKGFCIVELGEPISVPLSHYDKYDYTKLQCMIAPFNTGIEDSVAVEMVVFDTYVYNVQSTEIVTEITKNASTKCIDFNITNELSDMIVVHYFTYKEEG